ncbi:MAG: tRNA 2-thiouridine(34) synthase MnmA [Candidatus Omnitrophota bacterium]
MFNLFNKSPKRKKIAVCVSGGIDSAFALFKLKRKGYDVSGITMKYTIAGIDYPDAENLKYAEELCGKLNVTWQMVDVTKAFNEKIVDDFLRSYVAGMTPNPCALCNKYIKFGVMVDVMKKMGIDLFATGHYVRKRRIKNSDFFCVARDKRKSQEYFLALVDKDIIKSAIFPLANVTKTKVKSVMEKAGINFRESKESQDVCFVGQSGYVSFLEQFIDTGGKYCGDIMHVDGRVLGRHKGFYQFTYGQRSGLGIGWTEPLYVIDIDSKSRSVIVGEKQYLGCREFFVKKINCFGVFQKYNGKQMDVKTRYNAVFQKAIIHMERDGIKVCLINDAVNPAPGQVCAFYDKGVLIGGGIISRKGKV